MVAMGMSHCLPYIWNLRVCIQEKVCMCVSIELDFPALSGSDSNWTAQFSSGFFSKRLS